MVKSASPGVSCIHKRFASSVVLSISKLRFPICTMGLAGDWSKLESAGQFKGLTRISIEVIVLGICIQCCHI